jgi:hypothetical protein
MMSVAERIEKQIAANCPDKIFVEKCTVVYIAEHLNQIPERISTRPIGRWQLDKAVRRENCPREWAITYINVEPPKTPDYSVYVTLQNGGLAGVDIPLSTNRERTREIIEQLNGTVSPLGVSPFHLQENWT